MNLISCVGGRYSKAASKVKNNISTFALNHPDLAKSVAAIGVTTAMISNQVMADFDPTTAITKMAGYVCSILMGVGIIYALIAIFNWVSAIKQEDAERQSKSIVNIFIAGLLIAIKPISVVIINALGGNGSVIGE